jgi:hypothetical protein
MLGYHCGYCGYDGYPNGYLDGYVIRICSPNPKKISDISGYIRICPSYPYISVHILRSTFPKACERDTWLRRCLLSGDKSAKNVLRVCIFMNSVIVCCFGIPFCSASRKPTASGTQARPSDGRCRSSPSEELVICQSASSIWTQFWSAAAMLFWT